MSSNNISNVFETGVYIFGIAPVLVGGGQSMKGLVDTEPQRETLAILLRDLSIWPARCMYMTEATITALWHMGIGR